jgi:membrane protease YdiL (CAAX protease family)
MSDAEALTRDRKALVLFVVLAIVLYALAYRSAFSGDQADSIAGWAGLLLIWSPGLAGLLTSLVMYRSVRPLGLTGNRYTLLWIIGCIALPVLYALLIKQGLSAVGMIELAPNGFTPTYLVAGLFLSLISALGEELGWRGFASLVMTRLFGFWGGQTFLGLFWFLFYLPALLGTSYSSSPHPWFGNFMFLIS